MTTQEFPKYHTIATKCYADSNIPACWSEKVHGANVRFYCSAEGEMLRGSRNRTLGDHDHFFGMMDSEEWKAVTKSWVDSLREILGEVEFCLYGEFFGGKIQKEIKYSPTNHFRAFDIAVTKIFEGTSQFVYLNAHLFEELCNKCDIPYVPIHYGTWGECMSVQIEGVYSPLSLELSGEKEFWEGIVVKRVREFPQYKRTIVKRKTRQFTEVVMGARKNKIRGQKKPGADSDVIENCLDYVNANRLANILSHDEDTSNHLRLAGILATDALEEYLLDSGVELAPAVKKKTKAALTRASKTVIAEWAKE